MALPVTAGKFWNITFKWAFLNITSNSSSYHSSSLKNQKLLNKYAKCRFFMVIESITAWTVFIRNDCHRQRNLPTLDFAKELRLHVVGLPLSTYISTFQKNVKILTLYQRTMFLNSFLICIYPLGRSRTSYRIVLSTSGPQTLSHVISSRTITAIIFPVSGHFEYETGVVLLRKYLWKFSPINNYV